MSQQINLLLPELRPKRDWLAFPVVAVAALAGLALMAGAGIWGRFQVQAQTQRQAQADAELKTLQQQVQGLAQALAGRRPNAALQAEIDSLNESLRQREEALRVLEEGKVGVDGGYASLMRGFARQVMDGVWLTGFSTAGQDVEIRGRLGDPSLLPQYIRRLNGEATFQGRRFSALEMQDGAVGAPATVAGSTALPPRYTEFALRGNGGKTEEKAP